MVTLSRVITSCGGTSSTSCRRRDAHNLVNRPEHKDDARALGLRQRAAQPEDHAAFVFAQNLDGIQKVENDNGDRSTSTGMDNRIEHEMSFPHSAGIVLLRCYCGRRGCVRRARRLHVQQQLIVARQRATSFPRQRARLPRHARFRPRPARVLPASAAPSRLPRSQPWRRRRGALSLPRAHGKPHQEHSDHAKRHADADGHRAG